MKPIPTDRRVTYLLQKRSCGSRFCKKCRSGERHGPYIYAEWWENGKNHTAYVGKPESLSWKEKLMQEREGASEERDGRRNQRTGREDRRG